MLLKIAIDTIQRDVKKALGLKTIPLEATTASIKKRLADMGLTEPYDRTQCKEIASDIIMEVQKQSEALTVPDTDTPASIEVADTSESIVDVGGNDTTSTDVDTISAYENDDTPASTTPNSSELTVSQSTAIEFNQQVEALEIAINQAPNEIRQRLVVVYAEQTFNNISDILAFREQINREANAFLESELSKQNHQQTSYWQEIEKRVTENSVKEVANRQASLKSALDNFRAKIREYSS